MLSKVQICNRALSTYLGKAHINSLEEATPQAQECALHYDGTVRGLLEEHDWSFAAARQVLAELSNDRPSEWAHKYQAPAGALAIRWVNEPSQARLAMEAGRSPAAPYELAAGEIYCDVPQAACEFTREADSPSLFPQYFADAVSARLAANIAMPLTQDFKRMQNAMRVAEELFDRARARDEASRPNPMVRPPSDALAARGIL